MKKQRELQKKNELEKKEKNEKNEKKKSENEIVGEEQKQQDEPEIKLVTIVEENPNEKKIGL